MQKNQEIKDRIHSAGLYQWQIADALNITEFTLCRWMRKELSEKQKKDILLAINNLTHKEVK